MTPLRNFYELDIANLCNSFFYVLQVVTKEEEEPTIQQHTFGETESKFGNVPQHAKNPNFKRSLGETFTHFLTHGTKRKKLEQSG